MAAAPLSYTAVSTALRASVIGALGPDVAVETKKAPGDPLGDKVFALVVSSRFNGRTHRQRQRAVWDAIRGGLAPEQEARVALVVVRGTEDVW